MDYRIYLGLAILLLVTVASFAVLLSVKCHFRKESAAACDRIFLPRKLEVCCTILRSAAAQYRELLSRAQEEGRNQSAPIRPPNEFSETIGITSRFSSAASSLKEAYSAFENDELERCRGLIVDVDLTIIAVLKEMARIEMAIIRCKSEAEKKG